MRGYFDNSGDAEDRQHRVLTIGGFLAEEDQWSDFENRWQANLNKYRLPYLHMKEFAHLIPPFDIFIDKEEERAKFIQSCAYAIKDSGTTQAICHAVRILDVERFNNEYRRNIDAFSFCLYMSHIDMQDRVGAD
jgi:hypothetical protein